MPKSIEKLSSHRAHTLLTVLRENGGSCRTSELAKLLNVSEETVRRNIKQLAKQGAVIKVHGGVFLANSNDEPAFGERMEANQPAKRQMAARVAEMIDDGASLFIDNSSTTTFVADALRVRKNLFVVTNSIKAAERLSAHNQNRVFFSGGELRETDGGSYGAAAISFARGFNLDFAIMSASAVNPDNGIMLTDLSEAEIARVFIENANACILVADQSKIGRSGPIVAGGLSALDVLVTDTPVPVGLQDAARKCGLKIIVADQINPAEEKA